MSLDEIFWGNCVVVNVYIFPPYLDNGGFRRPGDTLKLDSRLALSFHPLSFHYLNPLGGFSSNFSVKQRHAIPQTITLAHTPHFSITPEERFRGRKIKTTQILAS